MKNMKKLRFSYNFKAVGKFLAVILVGILWVTNLPTISGGTALAENTGLGLSGSNPNRKFYESKVLDKPAHTEKADSGKGRFYREARNDHDGFYSRARSRNAAVDSGKMYPYNDVDPRRDTSRAEAKAEKLVKNAKQNVVDRAQDSKTVAREVRQKRSAEAERLKEDLKDTPKALGDRAKNNADMLKDEVERGSKNLQANAKATAKSIPKVAKQGVRNFEEKLDETADDLASLGRGSQRLADRASDRAQGVAQQTAKAVKDTVKDVSKSVSD
jgi:hypothetical protein